MAIPDAKDLVVAAMKKTGLEDRDTDFARLLKLDVHGPGKVGRWRRGESRPDYDGLMKILEAAGWLNMDGDAPAAARTSQDPLEVIAKGVRELLADQKELLRRTSPAEQREPPQSPARDRPKRTQAKGR